MPQLPNARQGPPRATCCTKDVNSQTDSEKSHHCFRELGGAGGRHDGAAGDDSVDLRLSVGDVQVVEADAAGMSQGPHGHKDGSPQSTGTTSMQTRRLVYGVGWHP